jgi:hypothetical protein
MLSCDIVFVVEYSIIQLVIDIHQSLNSSSVHSDLSAASIYSYVAYRARRHKHIWTLVCAQLHPELYPGKCILGHLNSRSLHKKGIFMVF